MPKLKLHDTNRYHLAVIITRCSRGAYLVQVDVGDEVDSVWAESSQAAAKAWGATQARGPVHWREVVGSRKTWQGFVLRKHYALQLDLGEAA